MNKAQGRRSKKNKNAYAAQFLITTKNKRKRLAKLQKVKKARFEKTGSYEPLTVQRRFKLRHS